LTVDFAVLPARRHAFVFIAVPLYARHREYAAD